jgi:tetratricopeptide (TPR) repeat protein
MGFQCRDVFPRGANIWVKTKVMETARFWVLLLFFAAQFLASGARGGESSPQTIAGELHSGNFQVALTDCDSLLARHPGDPMLLTLRGLALRGLGRWKASLTSFDRALKRSPNFPAALEAAAETAYLNKDARVADYLNQLLNKQPENETANAMAGVLAYEHHHCKTAIRHFERSVGVLVQNEVGASQYSACLLEANRSADAVSILAQAAKIAPGNKNLVYNLAVAQLQNGLPKDAVATLENLTSWSDPNAQVMNLLATAQTSAGDLEGSVNSLRKAIQIAPTMESNYLDLAILSLEHDNPEPALEVANAAISNVPNPSFRLYSVRGMAQAELSHYDNAQADFAKSLELQPLNPGAIAGKSLYYSRTDQPDKAAVLLREKLRTAPKDPVLNYLLADALVRAGAEPSKPEFKEAQAALQRSLQVKPDSVEALALAGKLYIKENDLEQASDVLNKAVHKDPENRAAMNQLLLVLRKLGRHEAAAKVAQQLTALVNRDRENLDKLRVDANR